MEIHLKKKRLEEEAAEKKKSSGSAEPSKRGSISQSLADKQSKRDFNLKCFRYVYVIYVIPPSESPTTQIYMTT